MDAEGIGAVGRMGLFHGLDVHLAGGVVPVEADVLLAVPVLGRLDGGTDVVGNGAMAILGHHFDEAVAVHHQLLALAILQHLRLEGGIDPDVAAHATDAVEVEKAVRLAVVADAVLDEEVPLGEVLVPVAELHVEATVHRLVVHLPVEPLAVGHRATPLGSAGGNRHD